MDGTEDSTKYSCVGAEAIQFHMDGLGYKTSEIPSISTIKRIIKRNKLKVNKRERYKRVHSKGRHTILNPKHIDELHQMDFVGPRHIQGYGPINSLHLKDVVGRQVAGQQYNVEFLQDYWKQCPIPKYLQVDNGMCFAGDYKHPKSFSRFVRFALYAGVEVVFIAPSKPWMNGTIEEFNKGFDVRFWAKERFTDLADIRKKSPMFFEKENKFNAWKLRNEKLKVVDPKRMLPEDFTIAVDRLPLVTGKIHFFRGVDSRGKISVLNEYFDVGKEYTGEYVWTTIETLKQTLRVYYKDEKLKVLEIKKFSFEIEENVHNRKDSIFKSGS
jgi:transposase InsO family protein